MAAGAFSVFTFGGPSLTEYIQQDGIFFDDIWYYQDKNDLHMSAYKIYTGSLHSFAVSYDLKNDLLKKQGDTPHV
jgi:hypothetical protein